jgi:hypothetical protein
MMPGIVRSSTPILFLSILLLAIPAADAAGPPSHSLLFKPWISGISGR